MALMVGCMSAFAQKIDKNELKELQAFLAQPTEKHATNAAALKSPMSRLPLLGKALLLKTATSPLSSGPTSISPVH